MKNIRKTSVFFLFLVGVYVVSIFNKIINYGHIPTLSPFQSFSKMKKGKNSKNREKK